MSSKKAKIFLINNELTVSEIARKIAPDDESSAKELSRNDHRHDQRPPVLSVAG
jgi:hypothetical protein